MKKHQKGMSIFPVVVIISLLVVLGKVFFIVGPAYYDRYAMDKIVQSTLNESRATSIDDIRRDITNRLQINSLKDRSLDDFKFNSNGRTVSIDMEYEVRKNFFANIDFILHFKKSYSSELKN
jgi:hypothetical protein